MLEAVLIELQAFDRVPNYKRSWLHVILRNF